MPELRAADLDSLATAARDGDREALAELVARLHDDLYRLALRMRWSPEDAADATQESLVRIVTRLSTWRGDASVRTWAWRIAVNHLRDAAPTPFERSQLSFERFAEDLADGREPPAPGREPDEDLLAAEVKVGCTLGMLQCLDRDHRLAYVLGDVLGLASHEAAEITGATPAAHRKRLSRARARLRHFVSEHCGLANPDAACRCRLRIEPAIRTGRLDPGHVRFATRGSLVDNVAAMEHLHDVRSLMRAAPGADLTPEVLDAVERAVAEPSG